MGSCETPRFTLSGPKYACSVLARNVRLFKVHESRYKQCGLTPPLFHSAKSIEKNTEKI